MRRRDFQRNKKIVKLEILFNKSVENSRESVKNRIFSAGTNQGRKLFKSGKYTYEEIRYANICLCMEIPATVLTLFGAINMHLL